MYDQISGYTLYLMFYAGVTDKEFFCHFQVFLKDFWVQGIIIQKIFVSLRTNF